MSTLKLKRSVRYTNCYKEVISFFSLLKDLSAMFSAWRTLTPPLLFMLLVKILIKSKNLYPFYNN